MPVRCLDLCQNGRHYLCRFPRALKRPLRDAVVSFAWFTTLLTPYMLFVVKMTPEQFVAWVVGVQAVLVPPLGVGYSWLLRRLDAR